MEEKLDNQLIDEAVAGSVEAFEVLVKRYQTRLVHSLEHALGSRDDALDAAQQAFVAAWRKLDSFRKDAQFYSWLYRIAMNAAISKRRKARVATTSLDKLSEASGNTAADSEDTAPDRRMESEENVRLVQEALQQIAEEFRQPLIMKEMDGFSYEEIASVLDIPVGTVRSRIFRARMELTARLERLFRED